LAREVHRRSVWQVVGVYVLAAWGAWALVGWLTEVSGLPSWTPTLTAALLLALFPVIVATVVVQGGLPGLRIEDEVDPNELVGLRPEQVLVIPEAHPLYGSGIFTWRNTVLGAVSSAALVVTSVVAYMVMWAFGIGPVGSLLAQGVIAEGDVVIVASFENRTDDPSLGHLLTDAFELGFERSQVITLSDRERTRSAAIGLGASAIDPMTADMALRVARQEGMRLVVSGVVTRRGGGYALESRIALPSGSIVAQLEESGSDDDDLLPAAERLSERVRERIGESLRYIRDGGRLAPISTDSIMALRLFRDAGRASASGDTSSAIALLEQAVAADPAFVMGWRRLGLLTEQTDRLRARDAYQTVIGLWAPSGAAEGTVARMRGRIAALD
jgi:hypothetical protein